ncbi:MULTISPECIES: hypothetical protein [Sphingomonadales]|uniref:hypothetical protein n=1 Tax=Sphingomonadales TaxID=204457 RepID=UPI003264284A
MKTISFIILLIFSIQMARAQEPDAMEGLPEHYLYMQNAGDLENPQSLQQLYLPETFWLPGQRLQICFFGGGAPVHELIAAVASQWTEHANIEFDFGPKGARYDCFDPKFGFSAIRIGFSAPGRWSLVGKDAVTKATSRQPSMNFQHYDSTFSPFSGFTIDNVVLRADERRKSSIIHEFGHALGLLHEHQSAKLNCWDEVIKTGPNNVYDFFRQRSGWSETKTKRNLALAISEWPGAVSGEEDLRNSIMSYQIPWQVLKDGKQNKCYINRRSVSISELDKALVAKHYPANVIRPVEDFTLAKERIYSLSPAADEQLLADYFQRIKVDLNSEDTAKRRDARVRLAKYISETENPEQLDKFTENLSDETYRTQLGVAVGINKSKLLSPMSEQTRSNLKASFDKSRDATLKANLQQALDASTLQRF